MTNITRRSGGMVRNVAARFKSPNVSWYDLLFEDEDLGYRHIVGVPKYSKSARRRRRSAARTPHTPNPYGLGRRRVQRFGGPAFVGASRRRSVNKFGAPSCVGQESPPILRTPTT